MASDMLFLVLSGLYRLACKQLNDVPRTWGRSDPGLRQAKALEQQGVAMHDVAFAHFYPLATGIAAQVGKMRGEYFDSEHPPAASVVLFEGLPSMNAGFAVDVVAVK